MYKKLVWGIIVIIMALTTGCTQKIVQTDEPSLLSAFIGFTDQRINSVQQNLQILAATGEVKSLKWEKMAALLTEYQKTDDGLAVWFMQPDGSYYTANQGRVNATLSDRIYYPDLVAGKLVTGALVVSKSTGQRSAIIAIPVMINDKVAGAIGASLFLDKLAVQIDSTLALRPDATFFALAPDGLTTLHRKTDRHFLDPRDLGSETLKAAVNDMLANPAGEVTYQYNNVTKKALYKTSPLTGWKFAIVFTSLK
ncbi:MAG TPA: hypothetical protein PLP19_20375 [bacterium]|nr:hypothetical protein [bacterium]HPN45853.1 hypothetical protein [bacterium]